MSCSVTLIVMKKLAAGNSTTFLCPFLLLNTSLRYDMIRIKSIFHINKKQKHRNRHFTSEIAENVFRDVRAETVITKEYVQMNNLD